MGALQELIHFCTEEKHVGALLLTGEWGCGKTYLIEKELAEALSSTHFIVRISLLGVDSVEELNKAVRKQWILKCTPFLGKLKEERERCKSFFSVLSGILTSLNPLGGSIASAFVAVDPMEYIPLEPEVDDFHQKGVRKRVVLVFDDLDRSRLNWGKFVGTINEYRENMGFTTIVIGDAEAIPSIGELDLILYKTIKEKTISRTVRYIPDYQKVIQSILTESKWQSQEYADFLSENQQRICDVFITEPLNPDSTIAKYHNIRSLICVLHEFYRFYEILSRHQVSNLSSYLSSFIAYMLVSRNGIKKNGKPCFEAEEEDIKLLYPDYFSELLTEGVRQWIEDGTWDEAIVSQQFKDTMEQQSSAPAP